MPFYNYENIKTGDIWSEERKMSEMMNGVDNLNIRILPSTPILGDPSIHTLSARKREKDFSKIIERVKRKNNPNARHL